ncbi:MAG: cyclase family protein [Candidatus Binataceae bacterium]|nr:cyclase family protein [Candidatus Binataceae bacterium]
MTHIVGELVESLAAGRVRIVDLTRPLSPQTPIINLPPQFAQPPRFAIETMSRYDPRGPTSYSNAIHVWEHTGTHFDAPIHWVTGKDLPANACDTIPAHKFIGPACVIDVTAQAAKDPDFLLMPEHILEWETRYGRIPTQSWVLLRTGWSKREGAAFLNEDATGAHSPGPHVSASRLLAHERDVLGIGVETVGTDAGQARSLDPPFPNHATMHGAGKFGLASLCNLDQLPPTGSIVVAAPLKIVAGSGSPVRVLGLVAV